MSKVYSQLLLVNVDEGEQLGAPPAGFIWVVRDICACTEGDGAYYIVADSFTESVLLIGQDPGDGMYHTDHWVGHQVIDTGVNLVAVCGSATVSLRISGYQLSLP